MLAERLIHLIPLIRPSTGASQRSPSGISKQVAALHLLYCPMARDLRTPLPRPKWRGTRGIRTCVGAAPSPPTARDANGEDEVRALCPRRRRRGARKKVTTARWAPPPMAKGPKGGHELSRALPSPPTAKGIKKDRYELAPSPPTARAADEMTNAPRTKTNVFTVARGQDTPFPTPVSRTDRGRRPRGWLPV